VFDRNQGGNGSQRVPRREVERQRLVTKSELLTVGGDHVALRPGLRAVIEQVPVGGRENHSRPEVLLQVLRSTRVVAVSMAHEHELDLGRVEPELSQTPDDFVFDRIAKNGVYEDDARRRGNRPGRVFALTDEVEVV